MSDFDEEINGVNLGKLFSIYGPNSVEHKKLMRGSNMSSYMRGASSGEKRNIKSGRSTSLKLNHTSNENDPPLPAKNSSPEKESEDFIVIKLMANMFTKKKSVRERLQMLPSISIDKLKKELNTLALKEKAIKQNVEREQQLWERQRICEKLFKKFE